MEIGFRRSGRTSRMLIDAYDAAMQGNNVFVVAADDSHAEILMQQFLNQFQANPTNVGRRIVNVGTALVHFIVSSSRVNMRDGRIEAELIPYRTFIDHYTIEREFPFAMEQWYKYQ